MLSFVSTYSKEDGSNNEVCDLFYRVPGLWSGRDSVTPPFQKNDSLESAKHAKTASFYILSNWLFTITKFL